MKTSITKLKSSFFFSLILVSGVCLAKPVAQVIEVKGQVFAVGADGKTKSLKANDLLEDQTEIMVGEDANVTLNDYYDATYHMIDGSHIKFFNKSVQLKKGKAWIQSANARHPLSLTTANGLVDFWKGEFITTFDQGTSKTQVLVVNGEVEVSNVLDNNMKYTVAAGTFTMIDPNTENGVPRMPTKVGLNSLNSALAEFKSLPQKLKDSTLSTAERSIASVSEVAAPTPKKGEIVFMSNGKVISARKPASVSAHQYFKKKVTAKKSKAEAAPIRFYGIAPVKMAPVSPRIPASVNPNFLVATPQKVDSELKIDDEFSQTLRMEKATQPNQPKELENLIQDLKSF